MNAKSFNLSVQGASHIKRNKECQDASESYYDNKMAVAVVCDGHGGDDYIRSADGSKLAAAVAKKNIVNFLNTISKEQFWSHPEKNIQNLEASIINAWNEAIYMHFNQTPFTEEELRGVSARAKRKYVQERRIESAYGTTLIAVAMTSEFWFGIHIGDGKCVAVNSEGKFIQPIPWDPKCFLNATTSICDSDALERFRHFYSEKLPAAVFVGSDGIDDCFSNNEQLHNLYKTILYSFGTSAFEEAKNVLNDYLPRLSAKGSGDDVSIAAMLDFNLVPELEIVKEFDREKEKARVEENVRKEAEKNAAEKRRVEEEHAKYLQQQSNQGRARRTLKFCTECGRKLAPGIKFCPSCGKRIELKVNKEELDQITEEIQANSISKENIMSETCEGEDITKSSDNNVTENQKFEDDKVLEGNREKSQTIIAETKLEKNPESVITEMDQSASSDEIV